MPGYVVYTLEDLKWVKPTKNQQGLPISRRVNFGFTGSSKPVEVSHFKSSRV